MKMIAKTKSIARDLADRLSEKSSRIPVRTQKRILIAALLLAIGQCLLMMTAPFGSPKGHTNVFGSERISPALLPKPEDNLSLPLDVERLHDLKSVMDSLKIYDQEGFWKLAPAQRKLLDSAASLIFP